MNKNVNTKSISNLKESKVYSRNSDFKSNLINKKFFSTNHSKINKKSIGIGIKNEKNDNFRNTNVLESKTLYSNFKLYTSPEMLQIKGFLKSDVKMRKEKERSRQSRVDSINKWHTNALSDNFDSYKSLFLTNRKEKSIILEKNESSSVVDSQISKNQDNGKMKLINTISNRYLENLTSEVGQNPLYDVNAKLKFENIRNFVSSKLKNCKMRYSLKIKEEQVKRKRETYNNIKEEIQDEYYDMLKCTHYFENKFLPKIDIWVKHLMREKEYVINTKEFQVKQKNELEAQLRQYENKLMRMKEKLTLYKEYKIFLVCVKEKCLNLFSKENESTIEKKSHRSRPKNDSSVPQKRNNLFGNDLAFNNYQDLILSHYDKNLFESPDDIIHEFKNLQSENLKKMILLNDLINKHKDIKVAFESEEDAIKAEVHMIHLLEEKTHLLEKLKEQNKILKGEKDKRKKEIIANEKIRKANVFNSKIYQLHHLCKDQNLYIIKKDNTSILNNKNVDIIALFENRLSDFDRLTFVEKVVNIIMTRYKFFFKNNMNDIREYEKEKDQERKRKLALDQRYENEHKKDKLLNKILSKYQRMYSLPKRKVAARFKPKDKAHPVKVFVKVMETLNFQDLITYEGNNDLF